MFLKKFFLLIFTLSFLQIFAQNAIEWNSAKILNEIKKLNTVGSVLYIAAHPDDENTRLISYLVNERHLRTGYLSLTRGDGGQNLIGNEQGEALGLIRTQELLAARKVDGAEQFFTRANDFGFSKNPEETLNLWDKEKVLSDIVLTIRRFRPDVIICRFPTTGEGGHGHHTASAILAMEAFEAAADPQKFPEQLTETQPWQTKRIFWNTFNFGGNNTTSPEQLKIDVGGFNPLLGLNYGEIAAKSRTMHKSQGFGTAMQRGENIEYFKFLKGDKEPKTDILEDINTTWLRLPNTNELQKWIADLEQKYDANQPEKSVNQLIKIYTALQKLGEKDADAAYWKQQKLAVCKNLITACAGIWAEAIAADYSTITGENITITAQIIVRNPCKVKLNKIELSNGHAITIDDSKKELKNNQLSEFKENITLNAEADYSDPYWLKNPHNNTMYAVTNQQLIGLPMNPIAEKATFYLMIENETLPIERPFSYKYTDPVKGEIYRPFEILPPATLNLSNHVLVFSNNQAKEISLTIKANAPNLSGKLQITAPNGWNININNPDFQLKNKGDEQVIKATITPTGKHTDGNLSASLIIGGKTYSKSITRIEYDHIPYQFFLDDASAKLIFVDLKRNAHKIGYIPGAGDNVATCLTQIGYDVTILTDELLAKEDLSVYSSIVAGVRAYNVNKRMPIYYNKLMNYVKKGGNLIVQYNTNNRLAPLKENIGPYAFKISANRVTDENATVTFTNPKHTALNHPNKISEKDFEGWVQERGIYFATDIDKNYETILSMNDPKEDKQEGSLIIGKYGKGNFAYTGLVFFRELPAGVPGAYRLFVNLLELPKNN
ncbi:MAG: PIG-L family deacetylase [Bacteroidia bacterium]|nr:PIG-L family deacetylase [Bacteroidia bacterium]